MTGAGLAHGGVLPLMRAGTIQTRQRSTRRWQRAAPLVRSATNDAEDLEALGRCEGWSLIVRLFLWSTRNATRPPDA